MSALLIVSTGRTGTAAIARSFAERYTDIVSLHEPAGSRILRIVGNLYEAGKVSERIARGVIAWTHGRRRPSAGTLIECNPQLCYLLPLIRTMYPDTQLVHVVRDPREFVRSYIAHGAFRGLKGFMGYLVPYWHPAPERYQGDSLPRWRAMTPVQASAWRWYAVNASIDAEAEHWGSRYMRVRYEDLFSGDPSEWRRIARAASLDPGVWTATRPVASVNASATKETPEAREWPPEWNDALQALCGAQMRRYGYAP